MHAGITRIVAFSLLGFVSVSLPTVTLARSAAAKVKEEARTRAVCMAEASVLKRKLPPGTCEDPRSALRVILRARELCERSHGFTQGSVKCRRNQETDTQDSHARRTVAR